MDDPAQLVANTYVFDPESAEEIVRLIRLDQFTTQCMGGPFGGLPNPQSFTNVLDLACGSGGWVLDAAYAYPHVEIAGLDISTAMISYANARARSQGLNNASFEVANVLQWPLEFSARSFDFVNARFFTLFMPRDLWGGMLQECRRLLRPGGLFRLTETDGAGSTNSPAYERLTYLASNAIRLSGYGFSANGYNLGITHRLGRLLREAAFEDIRITPYALEFSAGTPSWADFYHNAQVLFKLSQPRIIAHKLSNQQELDQLYQQMQLDMLSDDFTGIWTYISAQGREPG